MTKPRLTMNFFTLCFLRRTLAAVLLFLVVLFGAAPARAAVADLVVVCYNSSSSDSFALIALTNIAGGTRYFLTDSAWSTNSNNLVQEGSTPSPNRQVQFDVAAGGIPFGTVIKFAQTANSVALVDPSQGTLTMADRFTANPPPGLTNLSFSSTGDQLLIYQTAGGTVGGAVTMVSAFNASTYTNFNPPDVIGIANGWQTGVIPQPSQTGGTRECNLPAGLIAYNGANAATATALGLASFVVSGRTNADNYRYNGPYGLADKTAYLTAINNPANWSAADTVEFDLATVGPTPSTEINVQGNGVNILDGSLTALAADHTVFGSVPVVSGSIARTFTIQNVGTANLVVSNGITVSGANAAEFVVSGITLPVTLVPNASTNFIVTFDPTAAGLRTATVNIPNSDSNENPYDFAIQGQGYNYTPPAGPPPPLRWSANLQTNNVGNTRGVGGVTNGDIIAVTKINTGNAGNLRVTRHASNTGVPVWARDIDSGNADDANDVLVDPANGDTFIAARATINTTNLNWFVHKVNGADGTVAWTYTFDGTAVGADNCNALVRSSDGNIVVVGDTASSPSGINYARAVKLNAANGAVLFTYLSAVNYSAFNAVAADAAGNIYATGFINEPANGNGLTVKLNSSLGLVWSQTFDGAAALFDSFSQVVVHAPSGDCVVGGTTRISSTNTDAIIIRYASTAPGTEVWRRVISGAVLSTETMNHLVTDPSGDLYAAGSIRNVSLTDRDAYVAKITGTSGALSWITNRLGSAADSSDRFQNVRVLGGSVYAVGNLDNANRDIFASRFNAGTGAEEWTTNFNGTGNGADDVFSGKSVMMLLGTNTLAIGGDTFDVSGNTFGLVLKYAPFVPPVVSNVSKTNNEDTVLTFAAADFTGSYSDADGQALATVRIVSLPANGQLKLSGSTFVIPQDIALASIGNLTYTPGTNFNGSDSFGWNGADAAAFAVSAAQVNLTVREVNDAPTGTNDVLSNVNANSGPRTNSFASLLANDSKGPANESAQTLTITSVGSPGGGTASIAGTDVVFTPTANYIGAASYIYTLQDNGTTAGANDFKTSTATVSFNIVGVPPLVTCPANISTNANAVCPVTVAFNATATGAPAPAVSYRIGTTNIASPYTFPVGTHTVTVTATNLVGTNTCSFTVTVVAGAAPQLKILRSGTNVIVSWSNAFPCYTFQFAPLLSSNAWTTYPGPFTTNGGNIYTTNNAPFTNRYFRLRF